MNNFISLISGTSYDKNDVTNNGLRVLRGGNIQSFKLIINTDDVFLPNSYYNETTLVKKNDIIIVASTGSKEVIGKPAFVDKEYDNTTIGAFLRIIRPYSNESYNYLKIIFKSEYYRNIVRESVRGTNINNLKAETINNIFVPLPPLEEQQRIVDKINSFGHLIQEYDKYEKQLTELESTFADKLKKSILQYAIEGKLVKQDPNDEPASVLLERIKAEKEKLIKEGKIKRDKNESYIYQGDDKNYYEQIGKIPRILDDDFIYKLPNNILAQRFKTVLDVRDGTHDSPSYHQTGFPFISSKNLDNGKIDYLNIKYISKENFEKYNVRSNAEENDILFGMIGTIGNPAIIINPPFKFAFKNMALIKIPKSIFTPKYVYYYLLWMEKKFKQEASGGIQQFISLDYIRNCIITIPSLNYQKEVIEKIESILSL